MNLVFMSGGVSPLNIPAAMLSLFLLKIWTHILRRFDVFHQPFTRQENTIIQTCVVACMLTSYQVVLDRSCSQ